MPPGDHPSQFFNHHDLMAVLGHQVGERFGIIAAVEPCRDHLLRNGLFTGNLRAHPIPTRSVQL